MIFGTGIDIVEIERVGSYVSKGELFLSKVFTPREIEYCKNKGGRAETFAGKFAAKEAFMKALGTGWTEEVSFVEIEIGNDEFGKPEINLLGSLAKQIRQKGEFKFHVSISHSKDTAAGMVIIEKVNERG